MNAAGITTGGGFSNLATAPSFQRRHINKYFNNALAVAGTTPVNGYARNGRGIPDISLAAASYAVSFDDPIVVTFSILFLVLTLG